MILARVADSLYWMNRYLERMEHTVRMVGLQLTRMPSSSSRELAWGWRQLFASLDAPPPGADDYGDLDDSDDFFFADAYTLTDYLLFEQDNFVSARFCLSAARENARQVRDAVGSEIWSCINREHLRLKGLSLVQIWSHDPASLCREMAEAAALFDGVCAAAMRRDVGWHFMRLGRFVERAQLLSSLMHAYRAGDEQHDESDWMYLLRCCNAFNAYWQLRGDGEVSPEKTILDLLIGDVHIPYSLHHAVMQIRTNVEAIGRPAINTPAIDNSAIDSPAINNPGREQQPPPWELAGDMQARVDEFMAGTISDEDVLKALSLLTRRFHDALEQTYIHHHADHVHE